MRVEVDLLGQFRVSIDGRAASAAAWRRTSSVTLVKLLALARRHRLHREQVMDALWPDLEPEAAAANLRKAVHFTRRALGAHDIIALDGEVVALAPGAELAVDAALFEAEATAALQANDRGATERAARRYAGDLLPDDRYAEWAEEPRQRLRELYVRVLEAAGLWERLLAVDPADERAARALMQAALDAGNRGEVVRQFERLRESLRVDLGVGPQAATVAIYEKALALGGAQPTGIAERVRGLLAWGIIQLNSGDFGDAGQKGAEARTLAIAAELGREVGEASALIGLAAHMQGQWQELFQSEFVDWVRGAPSVASNVFDGHLCLAEFCLYRAGGHEHMAKAARELLGIAEAAGSVPGRVLASLILGEAELFSGRLTAAEELLTSAAQLSAAARAPFGEALALHRLGEIALARGQKWRAGRLLQKGLRLAESTWLAPHLLIRFQALAVEAAATQSQAMEAIRQGDGRLAEKCTCQPCSMGFRVASSIALAEAGELDQASRRIDEAERLAGMWQGGPWVAAVWEARGAHRQARGESDQASALLREAAARYAELGRPRDQERCLARAQAVEVRLAG
ncbi:AfsR/SARP family transcriptional regulator [Mesorhizobium abyssinicae]|uniref:AfsR/SARP family transcriptional regulator n=3 Tax=Mesorhizobium TaxID=68287 RepID=UPI0033923203